MPPSRPDPAGIFASDAHRRVLAHLSTPDSEVGWTLPALLLRIAPDPNTPIPPRDEDGLPDYQAGKPALEELLGDLEADGDAEDTGGGVWRMTEAGFDRLTGEIANPPEEGAPVEGPAMLGPTIVGSGDVIE